MPIYEYRCTECGRDFEKMQRVTDNPVNECVFCRGKVHKLISSSSFHLKGTGWYVTDYAKKSGVSQNNEAPKTPAAKSADSGTASSDASNSTPAKETTP
jgi:putative FmdB family regulatory protein